MERAGNAVTGLAAHAATTPRRVLLAALALALLCSGALALLLQRSTGTPAATNGAQSTPLALDYGPGYWAEPTSGAVLAASPRQQLDERYSAGGVTLQHGGATVGVHLSALAASSPRASLNRVTFSAPGISQWFANTPTGVQQGFTVAHPASAGATLTLNMALSGNTTARLQGSAAIFSRAGRPALRYDGLKATGAGGRTLPSHLALHGRELQIVVDTRGASYPLHIDPYFASEGSVEVTEPVGEADEFGASVSMAGNGKTAIVGAPQNAYLPGAAWILYRVADKWYASTTLRNPHGDVKGVCGTNSESASEEPECSFGIAVAISANGRVAAVGSPLVEEQRGAVYVYERSATESADKWTQEQEVRPESEEERGPFSRAGRSLALSSNGSVLAIGAPSGNAARGEVWVFKRQAPESGEWQRAGERLTLEHKEGEARLGRSLALSGSGEYLVAGAPTLAGGPGDEKWHGAAYVYKLSLETGQPVYNEVEILKDGEGKEEEGGRFGVSVAISEDASTILVGARNDGDKTGAAFVFEANGEDGWSGPVELQGHEEVEGAVEPAVEAETQFGYSVSLSANGSTALIGGPTNDHFIGAAWLFAREDGSWKQAERIVPSEPISEGGSQLPSPPVHFGGSVALSADGTSAIVGGDRAASEGEGSNYGATWTYITEEALNAEREPGSKVKEEEEEHEREAQEERERNEKQHLAEEEQHRREQKEAEEKSEVRGIKEVVLPPVEGVRSKSVSVTGTVTIEKPPGSGKFVKLSSDNDIPNGSVINATNGKITLELMGPHGKIEVVTLYGGEFKLEQKSNGYTWFTLVGGKGNQCPKGKKHTLRHTYASAARRHKAYRHLFVSGHGKFASKGAYASGAVLGTRWETLDFCEGTEIKVFTDDVLVTNLRTGKKTVVYHGHHKFIPS